MSESSNIAFQGGFTSGNPLLAGLHISIEPFPGWSLGVGAIMQYGGGEREESLGDLIDAFFNPSDDDNTGTDTRNSAIRSPLSRRDSCSATPCRSRCISSMPARTRRR